MSTIEWLRDEHGRAGESWNPVRARNRQTGRVGHHCEPVHEGCRFCYAERLNRNARNLPFGGTGLPYKPGCLADVEVFLDEEKLRAPLSWKRGRRVFVSSMDDPFGHWVEDAWLDRMFAVMALCPQHLFILLTKRPARARTYLTRIGANGARYDDIMAAHFEIRPAHSHPGFGWPLRNVMLGVSVSEQKDADAFVPLLLQTPAALRIVSAEPLLGPVDLQPWLPWPDNAPDVDGRTWGCQECDGDRGCDCPNDKAVYRCDEGPADADGCPEWINEVRQTLDGVIVGGESGEGARPMHPDWARSLRDQCAAAQVSFFFKQWGEWLPWHHFNGAGVSDNPEQTRFPTMEWDDGRWTDAGYPMWCDIADGGFDDDQCMGRVGKRRAGRQLDGVEHSDFPTINPAQRSAA